EVRCGGARAGAAVTVGPRGVMGPARGARVSAAPLEPTVPLRLPGPPPMTVSQLALLDADQPQPSAVRTSKLPVPPPDGLDAADDERVTLQPWPWLTVNVRPAIVIVPERDGPF